MAGLWNLFKIWSDEETLTNEDLNASFQTVRDNAVSDQTEGYSTLNNVSDNDRMDSTVDPYPNGSRSHASTVAGEIERLRYQLAQITGDQWYSNIGLPLVKPKIAFAFPFNGLTKESVASECARNGAMAIDILQNHAVSNTQGTGFTNNFLTVGDGKFGGSGIANYGIAAQGIFGSLNSGSMSFWFKQADANDVFFTHLGNAIECYVNSSGFLVVKMMMSDAESNTSKVIKTITGSIDITADSNWHHIIISWNLNSGVSSDFIKVKMDGASLGTDIVGVALNCNVGRSCPFVFNQQMISNFATRIAAYDAFNVMNLRPDDGALPAGLQFVRTTSGTVSDSVSGGSLSMSSDTSSSLLTYTKASPNIGVGGVKYDAIEAKIKITRSRASYLFIKIRDNTNDKDAEFRFTRRGVNLYDGSATLVARASIDFEQERHIEIVYERLGGNAILYVDGIRMFNFQLSSTAGSGASGFSFGIQTDASTCTHQSYIEYIGVRAQLDVVGSSIGYQYAYKANSTDCKISDVICFDEAIDVDGVLSSNLYSGDLIASMFDDLQRDFYVSPYSYPMSDIDGLTRVIGIMSDGFSKRNIMASVVATNATAQAEAGVSLELMSGPFYAITPIDDDGTIGRLSSPNSLFGIGSIPANNYYTSIPINTQLALAPWYTVVSAVNGSNCTPSLLSSNITVSEV